jgi:hypothetical protein
MRLRQYCRSFIALTFTGCVMSAALTACSSSTSEPSSAVDGAATIAGKAALTTLSAAQTLQVESSKAVIGGLLQSLNGGSAPDPKDIECVSASIDPGQMQAMMSAALGGGGADSEALQTILAAVFACNPKGLAETLSEGLGVVPADLTPEQRTCTASATLKAVSADPAVLAKLAQSTSLSALDATQRETLATSLRTELAVCSLKPETVETILNSLTP